MTHVVQICQIDEFFVKLTSFSVKFSKFYCKNVLALLFSLGKKLMPIFDAIFWCIPLRKNLRHLDEFFRENTFFYFSMCYFDEFFVKTLFLLHFDEFLGWFSKLNLMSFLMPYYYKTVFVNIFHKVYFKIIVIPGETPFPPRLILFHRDSSQAGEKTLCNHNWNTKLRLNYLTNSLEPFWHQ